MAFRYDMIVEVEITFGGKTPSSATGHEVLNISLTYPKKVSESFICKAAEQRARRILADLTTQYSWMRSSVNFNIRDCFIDSGPHTV